MATTTSRGDTTSPRLNAEERALAQRLVREAIHKQHKNLRGLVRKWGAEADLTQTQEKLRLLESLYRKYGGDPAAIPTTGDAGEGETVQ